MGTNREDIICYDIDGLKESPELQTSVAFTIARAIDQQIGRKDNGGTLRPTIAVFDEVWAMLADPVLGAQILNAYREPSHARSLFELAITAAAFATLWTLACIAYLFGFWWASMLLAIPAGAFMVRAFTIQHDCGHGAFFTKKWANDWVGRVLGVVTMTPPSSGTVWQREMPQGWRRWR